MFEKGCHTRLYFYWNRKLGASTARPGQALSSGQQFMPMGDVEHRSLKRQFLRARVIFLLRDECEDEIGELRDMNFHGAFFYTKVAVTMGAELLLLLLVRSEGPTVPVFCAGQAVRIEEGGKTRYAYGVAVKFWQLDTPDTLTSGS